MKKVLISGGAGFIGSNLALKLLKENYEITVLDNLSRQVHGDEPEQSYTYQLIRNKVRFIRGTVESTEDWMKAISDNEIIIHLAAETGTGQSMYEISKYVDVNIGGTAKLLEVLTNEKHHVAKLILASSRAVYGEGKFWCPDHHAVYPEERKDCDMKKGDYELKCPFCGKTVEVMPTDEDSLLHPSSVYGYTKKSQEELCMLVGKALQIPVIVFRFQNVYGPGQSLKNPYTGILSIFSTQIKNNHDLNIFEDGKETRDFVYIDDVTDAILSGIENKTSDNQIFNVGSGVKIDVLEVADTLKGKYGNNISIRVSGNYRIGDIRHNVADLTKIKNALNYRPKVNFKQGISDFVDWVEKQETEHDDYEESIEEMKQRGLYK